MPYINIKVAGTLSIKQKKDIAQKVSAAMEEVAGKAKKSTYIVFEEIERDNWAVGENLLSEQ